jgi:hypothetical protein
MPRPKILCKVLTARGGWAFLRDETRNKRVFPSFKKAQEAACPEFHPNGQRKITPYKATRIN